MVGLLQDVTRRVPSHFSAPGDSIVLLGASRGHLGGSSYWEVVHGFVGGAPPPVDLQAEATLQLPGGRGGAAAAPLGARLRRWRPGRGAGGGLHRRAVCDGLPGREGESRQPGRTRGRRVCSTARTGPSGRIVRESRSGPLLKALAAEHQVPARIDRLGPRAAEPWNYISAGARRSAGPRPSSGEPISTRSPAACERTRVAERVADMCGIIGVSGVPDAARVTYLGLYALQHRGQESAGIVTIDARTQPHSHRGMGLVGDIFNAADLAEMPGRRCGGPHPLLDHRQLGDRQRAALRRQLPLRPARDRPQRQSHQRDRPQAGAGGARRHLYQLERHGSAGSPDRPVRPRHARGPDPGSAGPSRAPSAW